jgi:hypothetical protein
MAGCRWQHRRVAVPRDGGASTSLERIRLQFRGEVGDQRKRIPLRLLTDPDVRSALLEAFTRQIARTRQATEVP